MIAVHLKQHAFMSWTAGAGQLCKAVACLTDEHPAVQQACRSAIAPMVALLSHPDTPVQDEACQALACLVSDCPQHQMAAGQAGAVLTLMNLLCDVGGEADSGGDSDSRQRPIQVVHLVLALLLVATQVCCCGIAYLSVL